MTLIGRCSGSSRALTQRAPSRHELTAHRLGASRRDTPTGVMKPPPFDLEDIGFGRSHTAPRAKIERRNHTLCKTDLKILQNKFPTLRFSAPQFLGTDRLKGIAKC
jgi:hypothetical protein